MSGFGYLFVLGVVVFSAGWLAKDWHERHLAEPLIGEPVVKGCGPRVIPPAGRWRR